MAIIRNSRALPSMGTSISGAFSGYPAGPAFAPRSPRALSSRAGMASYAWCPPVTRMPITVGSVDQRLTLRVGLEALVQPQVPLVILADADIEVDIHAHRIPNLVARRDVVQGKQVLL